MLNYGYQSRRGFNPPIVPIAPLIDVVFLLLIFFMLIASFQNPAIEVNLPGSSTAASNDQKSVTVLITESGGLFLDNEPVDWDDLASRLFLLKDDIDLVRLAADRSTPYEEIIRAMDAIRNAGITGLAMETDIDSGSD